MKTLGRHILALIFGAFVGLTILKNLHHLNTSLLKIGDAVMTALPLAEATGPMMSQTIADQVKGQVTVVTFLPLLNELMMGQPLNILDAIEIR